MRTGIIYGYTNLESGKMYIGQTIDPKRRCKQHLNDNYKTGWHIDYQNNPDKYEYSVIEYWEKPDKDSEYSLIETSDKVDNAKDFDDYFSRFHNFKYSIYMKIFNESIDVRNPTYLDRAIDESLTLHGRADARHLAYKKNMKNNR